MDRILFVCTGNTCRSPMAEAIAKYVFDKSEISIAVESRGIAVQGSTNANEKAIKAVKTICNIEMNHKSKQITNKDLENFDLILTMTEQHKMYILSLCNYKDKVKTVSEYAYESASDISDPYGGSIDEYMECAKQIHEAISKIADKVSNHGGELN